MAEEKPEVETTEAIAKRSFPPDLPLLATGEVVIYPYMAAPLLIDDATTIRTVEEAMKTGHKVVALFGRQKSEGDDADIDTKDVREHHMYRVGTAIQLVRSQRAPDGKLQLLVHGISRVLLERIPKDAPYPMARVKELQDIEETTAHFEKRFRGT